MLPQREHSGLSTRATNRNGSMQGCTGASTCPSQRCQKQHHRKCQPATTKGRVPWLPVVNAAQRATTGTRCCACLGNSSMWQSKIPWTAAQWRNYRREKGIPPKADMPTILPKHIAIEGQKIARMLMIPVLDWQPDLFEDIMVTKNSTAPMLGKDSTVNYLCACGCKQRHNSAVSRTLKITNASGRYARVLWYRTIGCRDKHAGNA